ncbi:hypothetical protein GQ44DRAFT_635430, partial [Phaeosphaeriaceae sp. PMI808]
LRIDLVVLSIVAYIAFPILSFKPLIEDLSKPEDPKTHSLLLGILYFIHSFFLDLIFTVLSIAALYFQIKEVQLQRTGQALSRTGLAF